MSAHSKTANDWKWICVCSAINPSGSGTCHNCGRPAFAEKEIIASDSSGPVANPAMPKQSVERDEAADQYGLTRFPIQWVRFPVGINQEINHARRISHVEAFKSGWDARNEEVRRLSEIATLTKEARDHWRNIEAENKRLNRVILKELTENDELGCEYTYVNALREENERLRGIEQDHLDDWKRIQDAERKCEGLEAEVNRLKEEIERLEKRYEDFGEFHELGVKAENKRLKEQLEVNGVHSCSETCQRPACVLRRENKRLREALQFYAKEELYILKDDQNGGEVNDAFYDSGETARAAMKKGSDNE